jgi:hypothetical protein
LVVGCCELVVGCCLLLDAGCWFRVAESKANSQHPTHQHPTTNIQQPTTNNQPVRKRIVVCIVKIIVAFWQEKDYIVI